MVAPFAKVMPNKVTVAVMKFVNSKNSEIREMMKDTLQKELDNGADRVEIINKLKLTFFMASLPVVLNEQTASLGMTPYLLKIFAFQLERVDWECVLERVLRRTDTAEMN
jgi:hypothetical protein